MERVHHVAVDTANEKAPRGALKSQQKFPTNDKSSRVILTFQRATRDVTLISLAVSTGHVVDTAPFWWMQFMLRAAQKEEKQKEAADVVSNGEFVSAAAVSKKWRSDPRSSKGSMSFQHFNPSIDKLAEASDSRSKEPGARTPSWYDTSANGNSDPSNIKADHKRKQPVRESEEEPPDPNKSPKNAHPSDQQTNTSPSGSRKGSHKKREKNDCSALQPLKSQSRQG